MKWPAFAVTLAAVASIGTATLAQDAWPTKAVVVVVPFAAGGNTDVLARIFAERLSARLRQQFVIENRAGGGGTTGVAYMTSVFKTVCVVGRSLVFIGEVHAIVARARSAQGETEMARDRFGFLERHGVVKSYSSSTHEAVDTASLGETVF
jgi:Tripartite tricarboxylate transporter family receptor